MEVEVIKANNPFDESSKVRKVDRLRVAAYCRVSTDDEDQIKSYNSMVKYYTDFIQNNKQWVFAGVYADKAITGTKVDKREDFQRLIQDCMDGKVDLIITQKVSNVTKKPYEVTILSRMLATLKKPVGIYFISEDIFTLASYYQEDMRDTDFFPEGWVCLPDDEPERRLLND